MQTRLGSSGKRRASRSSALALTLGLAACRSEPVPAPAAESSGARAEAARAPARASVPRPCEGDASAPRGDAEIAFLPQGNGYCLDRHSDPRSYGASDAAPLASACELLAGGCEPYERHGLARLTTVEYVAADGSPARVLALVARFGSAEGAFGSFTSRTRRRGSRAGEAFEPLSAGAAGALGATSALVYRAERVIELRYSNERTAPSERERLARRALPELAAAIGRALPGTAELPRAASLLPTVGQRPLSTYYAYEDLLGIPGFGRGAVAEYHDENGPFFMLAAVAFDDDAAKDVLKTLRRKPGAKKLSLAPHEATRLAHREGDAERIGWVFGRKGLVIAGVGRPSPPKVRAALTPREREKEEGPAEREKLRKLSQLFREIALD